MDGMFYRRESSELEQSALEPSVAKLVLITCVAAVCVVAVIMLLSWLGMELAMPSEFPSIAPDAI